MNQYIISGDTENNKNCLIYVCGNNREKAEKILERMLAEPTEADKKFLETHTNIRVEAVDREDAWWLD